MRPEAASTTIRGCGILVCVTLLNIGGESGCAARRAPAELLSADAVVGLWRHPSLGVLRIARRDDHYVMIGVADSDGEISEPDTIGEFRRDAKASGEFVGRHTWGGRWGTPTDGPMTWGVEGGLRIQQRTRDSILVRYTDSQYSDGWTYERDAEH